MTRREAIDPLKVREAAERYGEAWTSGSPAAVAACYTPDGQITINRGETLRGRAAIADMAAGFHAAFPGLAVLCDEVRTAGDHVLFAWTLKGRHVDTGNDVCIVGWEEWELDEDCRIRTSLGWFDVDEYERQIAGGG